MEPAFLTYIIDPNIAYLLMLVAIFGLFFEFTNPGLILPGAIGIISLLLAFYAFNLLPINYTGLLLLLSGIILMIFEVFISSFGIAGILGIVAFITGSFMLFDPQHTAYRIAWPLILAMSILSFTFIFMSLTLAIQSHKRKIVSGKEGLIGSEGIVLSIMNKQIVVRVLGEIWAASSSTPLETGDKIKVVDVKGLVLYVEPSAPQTISRR